MAIQSPFHGKKSEEAGVFASVCMAIVVLMERDKNKVLSGMHVFFAYFFERETLPVRCILRCSNTMRVL